ncbi:MAG: bifunctional [glutamate--ammonia ligase]-adenylyl-L-tyrosine phosphorylase/[glutamate--ammonia-ligase] adenylyltransferase [Betaproteobacteria bacterium]
MADSTFPSPPATEAVESLQAWAPRVLAASAYAKRMAQAAGHGAQAAAWLVAQAAQPWDAVRLVHEFDVELGAAGGEAAIAVALRRLRRRLLPALALRDAAGCAPLSEVVGAMTAFAELAVQRLLPVLADELAQRFGVPLGPEGAPQELLVVAMGKGGGGELNVSSDLDLVFVFDAEGETAAWGALRPARGALSHQEFFERLGRRLIAALSDVTGEGFVFRVDMRLRPNGDAGPLAVSTTMLEEYLVQQGREWERFAWLKGRVISRPVWASAAQFEAQLRALDDVVRPFVFRKYLDFNAIAALRQVHALIRAETGRRSARRADGHEAHESNVKLGRGGIREIEFIAQTFQVIRGGREPRLRSRSTLVTLRQLAALDVLPAATAAELEQAYEFLRRLEHALQYVDDAQTHVLPAEEAALAPVALLLDTAVPALRARFEAVREVVAAHFDAIFVERVPPALGGAAAAPLTEAALAERLAALGYAQPPEAAQRIGSMLASRRVTAASQATRSGIERLLVQAIDVIAGAARGTGAAHDVGPDEVLARFVRLLEVICGRGTYVALLVRYPHALERVLRLLQSSRWATEYLLRHPILLDELLDDRLLDREPNWIAWQCDVEARLLALGDSGDASVENSMNLLRDAHHAQVFRLLMADLEGQLTVERLADHLSALADGVLALTLSCAWGSLPRRHRERPAFAVVAYGKLGGKELGYASDLDLIFLYDDPHPDAAETYALLVRRLMNWLTAQTPSGMLFEIDLRLRPNGNAGLLVSSIDAFERYQRNEDGLGAWTWEHQALTRARVCAGDAGLAARFERLRGEILSRPRDLERLRADVLSMRRKMHEGHPNRSALFDLKHDAGGMVDVEFIVQTLVLGHADRYSRLVGNAGNIALLLLAGQLELVPAGLAQRTADAYRHMRAVQHRLRLNGAEYARVEPAEVAADVAAVQALWLAVFGQPA